MLRSSTEQPTGRNPESNLESKMNASKRTTQQQRNLAANCGIRTTSSTTVAELKAAYERSLKGRTGVDQHDVRLEEALWGRGGRWAKHQPECICVCAGCLSEVAS
jgi:hypothetical protein